MSKFRPTVSAASRVYPVARKFVLRLKLDHDAIQTRTDVAVMLRKVADQVMEMDGDPMIPGSGSTVHDLNGNRCGEWEWES